MNILVVYDSYFGNTEKVAKAIGDALAGDVQVLRVGDVSAEQLSGLDYIIVGSPTRAFKATKAVTDFLNKLPSGALSGVKVAAFDTRMDTKMVNNKVLTFMVGIFGYAAKPIADRLQKKGGVLVAEPEGFIVLDSEGPMKEGELERAAAWAQKMIAL
jgi:flavodoxin I